MQKILLFLSVLAVAVSTAPAFAGSSFHPVIVWQDTDGKPINAHGGGVLFHEGTYYWYGEMKVGKTFLPDCNKSWGGTAVKMTGVSCYSSTNLLNWKNEGIALAATPNVEGDLNPGRVLERPKVIYNRTTHQFVMWMHIDSSNYAAACSGVAVSDKPAGPYKYLGSFRPDAGVWPQNVTEADKAPGPQNVLARDFAGGQMARDMTLFQDDDGKAYLFYSSEENPTMHVSLLTDDYLHTAGKYTRIFAGRSMEAPAVFKHGGKYYFVGSGCTGWEPNAARSAMADSPLGPWTEAANPCTGPDADKTFHGQAAYVLPVQGQPGHFIFMGDHWKQWDLESSTYIWLPVKLKTNGTFNVPWRDEWDLSARGS